MGKNKIYRFGENASGQVILTDEDYEADEQREIGHQLGVARPELANKALRGVSAMASSLAQFVSEEQDEDVSDGQSTSSIAGKVRASVKNVIKTYFDGATGAGHGKKLNADLLDGKHLIEIQQMIADAKQEAKEECYPVGSYYWNKTDGRNPATVLGFGTWVAAAKGRVVIGVGSNGETIYNNGQTGGTDRVYLDRNNLPRVRIPNGMSESDSTGVFVYGKTTQDIPGGATTTVDDPGRNPQVQGLTDYLGNGFAHENRMPYETSYVWYRIR